MTQRASQKQYGAPKKASADTGIKATASQKQYGGSMKAYTDTGIKTAASAVFTIVAFAFFAFRYTYHVQYQETLQLLLLTRDYAAQVLSEPGGAAIYAGRLLVQFFCYPTVGALIIALLLLGIQLASWSTMPRRSLLTYPLSYVTPLVVWASLCNENGMLTTAVSLLLSLAAAWCLCRISNATVRYVATCLSMPLMYAMAGSLTVVTPVIVLINSFKEPGKIAGKCIFALAIAAMAWLTLLIAHRLYPHSIQHLRWGIGYYRFINVAPYMAWYAAAAAVAVPCISLLFRIKDVAAKTQGSAKWRQYIIAACVAAAVAISGYIIIDKSADYTKEDIFEYLHLANTRQWQEIIDKADDKMPDDPYSATCLNLALGMTGQMGEKMFGYTQNGDEGLMPNFMIDFTVPLVTSEVLYNIGMVNAAQRYVYEAQEAIPDFQKSSRCYRRLAELNMLKGNDETAMKYLKTLSHTMMHKGWAEEMMALVGDSSAISRHDVYGPIKAYNCTTDIFMADNATTMLVNMLEDNPENRLAFDYLIAKSLLDRDLESFYTYLSSCTFPKGYVLPKSYQEALALMWVQTHPSWEGEPWGLSPQTKHRMESFLRDNKANRPADYLTQKYGDTYWVYYYAKR